MKQPINLWVAGILLLGMLISCNCNDSDVESCSFNGLRYKCHIMLSETVQSINFPEDSCVIKNCEFCLKVYESKVLLPGRILVTPTTFVLTQRFSNEGTSKFYDCSQDGLQCDCDSYRCNGTQEYCEDLPCNTNAKCFCEVKKSIMKAEFTHGKEKYGNPIVLTYQKCLFEMQTFTHYQGISKLKSRELLSDEEAAFIEHDIKVQFKDPIFTLPEAGTLIIRKNGIERVSTLTTSPYHSVVPDMMLLDKGSLHFIFVTKTGKSVQGVIHLEGRELCRRLNCFICFDVIEQINCLPGSIKYVIVVLLIILTAIMILYVRLVLKMLFNVGFLIYYIGKKLFSGCKGVSRFTMLSGVITGDKLKGALTKVKQNIEEQALLIQRRALPNQLGMTLIVMFLMLPMVAFACTNHIVQSSEVRECTETGNIQHCKLYTKLQITLLNLGFSSCLWFTSPSNSNLFSIKITFKAVKCKWLTSRLYYTFPVELQQINQVSCPQNQYCAWGTHCHENYVFETVTKQAMDLPGENRCMGGDSGSMCAVVYAQPCLHARLFYSPRLTHSYEVRKIKSMICEYIIEIEESHNDTIEVIQLKDHLKTASNIEFQIIGAYNQPVEILNTNLIVRVGDHTEAYLEKASEVSRPRASEIGDIQANRSVTKHFIYAPHMTDCTWYENNMRCTKIESYLLKMIDEKINHLPLTLSFHVLNMDNNGELVSTVLQSAPLVLHLSFTGYQFALETHTVCPKIVGNPENPTGCYDCDFMAKLKIRVFSTCLSGTASVTFLNIVVATRSVKLTTSPELYEIEFKTSTRCHKEKICFNGRTISACQPLNFCLMEPNLSVYGLNYSRLATQGLYSSGSDFWDSIMKTNWIQYFGNVIKYPMYLITTVGLCLFIISLMLSICKR